LQFFCHPERSEGPVFDFDFLLLNFNFRNLKSLSMPKPPNMFELILAQIRRVPRGKVATYGDVAYAAGFPGAARQTAWALHGAGHGVPWQRIVGSGGKILLTGEHGFEQRMRLQSEGVQFHGLRVDMKNHHHSFFSKKKAAKKKSSTSTTPARTTRNSRPKKN
jgi:methylated-DNA-protein-cysteine methyltransferase related protein